MPAETGARRTAPRTRSRSGGASPRMHIAELQRARLLSAAVLVVDELGWSATTVAHITARARVSRRTFYDLFENREDCLLAILRDVVGPAVARSERNRALPTVPRGRVEVCEHAQGVLAGSEVLRDLPMRLTYRTARVLDGVAAHPGASNRMVAEMAGITDQGQVSKLLARLKRLGLLTNVGAGQAKGEPNAWTLTVKGDRVADSIGLHADTRADQERLGIHV